MLEMTGLSLLVITCPHRRQPKEAWIVSSWTRRRRLELRIFHEPRREAAEASATAWAHTLSRAFTSLGSSPVQFVHTMQTARQHKKTITKRRKTRERFATKQKHPGRSVQSRAR
jgi:hypothetical protein